MRFLWRLLIALVLLLEIGCASLRGVPVGLYDLEQSDSQKLASEDLKIVFDGSDSLSAKYKDARNDNLNYVFGSNFLLILAAGTAAGGILFKSSTDFLSVTALSAGVIAGTNTFINARNNATVYQHGIDALTCIKSSLNKFTGKAYIASTKELQNSVGELVSQIKNSQELLITVKGFDFTKPTARDEIKNNKTAIADFTSAQKDLSDAISKATTVLASGNSEITAFNTMSEFARGIIYTVDQLVAAKITQPPVDFATLRDSISTTVTGGIAAKTKDVSKAPAAAGRAAPEPTLEDMKTIADMKNKLVEYMGKLVNMTSNVSEQIKQTGVIDSETTATNCQKKI